MINIDKNKTDYFITADLALSAALALFFPVSSLDKTSPSKILFLFNREGSLDRVVERYWRGDLQVEPLAYFNQLKALKSRIYSNA